MNQPVTPQQRLDRISEDGMCIGCGLCESIAGPDVVRMEVVENGYERPVVCGGLSHETVDRIMDLCPGTRVEGLPVGLIDETTQHDLVWGAYQSMVLGHASDPQVRHQGSTGGVLTALGQFLVETGEVEFVLHAKASERDPTFG
ncbi:MAG: coenzyme F420 hydrogenase/dehydrogenase beta subunit N-terminal domain-containing protein, partial [Alphaproteobacteria bacterium]